MAEQGPDLSGRDVANVNLVGSRVRGLWLGHAKVTGAWLENASIEGDFEGLIMNGVEVAPLIEAEIERMHPVLKQIRTLQTADDVRASVETAYGIWDALLERASSLDEEVLHERVDDEWSFVETLRHLIYATDGWFRHVVLDLAEPYHAIAVSHSEAYGEDPGIDLDASPTFVEVLAVWRDVQAEVRAFAAAVTDAGLVHEYEPKASPGNPNGKHSLRTVFWVLGNEEYWHSTYATRDLDALAAG